jgi:adenylyltransferase/sulfurtransferase
MTTPPVDPRGLPANYPFQPDWEATPREVRQALADPASTLLLVDCRTPEEHRTASIKAAILIPMNELSARIAEIRDHDGPVVVHCHHGGRSLKVTAALRQAGIPDVKSMAGGIDLWSLDIDPSVPRY